VSLAGKTVFITGASRGIGAAIAKRVAKAGSNVVIVAKTGEAHPKLPGTINEVAQEIEQSGGKALAVPTDIRYEDQVAVAVKKAVQQFGGIDILVNNASAIWMQNTTNTPIKKYDLMNQVNARGTYLCTHLCLPHLIESAKKGRNPHVLNLSPPLNMSPKWFGNHVAYTIAKYGMSMCALGMAEEFKDYGIGVNCLWPRTGIATAAIEFITNKEMLASCRNASIMSDAAYYILRRKSTECTGNFFIDDELLLSEGLTQKDLENYAAVPGYKGPLMPDFFLDSQTPDPQAIKAAARSKL